MPKETAAGASDQKRQSQATRLPFGGVYHVLAFVPICRPNRCPNQSSGRFTGSKIQTEHPSRAS